MKRFNHIARFFDQLYIWKNYIDIFDFLHGGINKGRMASVATAFGCVCPDIPMHAQTSEDLQQVYSIGLWVLPD